MDGNLDHASIDIDASCRFRAQVLAYTRHWLGLNPVSEPAVSSSCFSWFLPGTSPPNGAEASHPEPFCPSLLCATFKEFGQFVHRNFSKGLWNHAYKSEPPPLSCALFTLSKVPMGHFAYLFVLNTGTGPRLSRDSLE
jgi:hypothetical protein